MADVSVIISTWNRADALEKAVRSALEQTLSPLEVLVCDDGSTDGSKERVDSIGDSRVRWIEGPRGGRPAIPRNRGIKESKGSWLAFLDDDDEWLPEKLETQLNLAKNSGCQAVCSNARRYIPGKGLDGNLLECDSERITFNSLLQVNQVICSSSLVSKTLISIVAGFPEDQHLKAWEDYAFWLRIATQTDFAFVAEPLLIYRDDVSSSLRNENVDELTQRKAVFGNFTYWGEQQGISEDFLRKTRRQVWRELLHAKAANLEGYVLGFLKALLK